MATFEAESTSSLRVPRGGDVIDAHTHWYPTEWIDLLLKDGEANGAKLGRDEKGQTTVGIPGLGVTLQPRYTDIATRLATMDDAGVTMHAMSLTQPMVYWATPDFGLKLSQVYNDACAALHKAYPRRFIGFATVPMQAPELAVREIDRVAGMNGVPAIYMATHINGRNLEEKDFWPVFERCEHHGLPIFLHPLNTVGADRMRNYHMRNFLGNPFETAIAAASLMFSGLLDAFPKLDIVLAHAGGPFPTLLGRMTHGATVRKEVKVMNLKHPPSAYARRFHYDTIAHDTATLMNLTRQVGVDRIIGGTDFPADMALPDLIDTVAALTELSTEDRHMILRGNAVRLLKL